MAGPGRCSQMEEQAAEGQAQRRGEGLRGSRGWAVGPRRAFEWESQHRLRGTGVLFDLQRERGGRMVEAWEDAPLRVWIKHTRGARKGCVNTGQCLALLLGILGRGNRGGLPGGDGT